MATNSGEGSGESSSPWTWEQNKAFEIGLATFPENFQDRWEQIAAHIPGNKTIEEVKLHYQLLVDDLELIESGNFPLISFTPPHNIVDDKPSPEKEINGLLLKGPEWETRRGKPWTEEEHKQFLLGLDKYGKGDWKTISREYVKTRTPTQVASHAQKYFTRQKKTIQKKRRSIFDITTTPGDQQDQGNDNGDTSVGKEPASLVDEKEKNEQEKVVVEGSRVFDDELPLSPPESWCLGDEKDLDVEVTSFSFDQVPPPNL